MADVAHRCVDLVVRWIWPLPQERHGRHDLSGLAIAALGNVQLLPCKLDGMRPIGGQTFDGRDFRANGSLDRERAGARWPAVDVNGTSTAVSNAAGELGAREAYGIAQDPQKRRFRLHIYGMPRAVDVQHEPHIPNSRCERVS